MPCFSTSGTYTYATGFNGPRLGTSRRNTLDGPGLFFWRTGLRRDQPITERVRAQFQVQAFNASNHANFANPAAAQLQLLNVSGAFEHGWPDHWADCHVRTSTAVRTQTDVLTTWRLEVGRQGEGRA